jgi:DNA segregation ATPase FtsK/SpoIIIE, S-DNA-T family
MRSSRKGAVTGESFAQVNNPDPFAPPVWRSPVYRTPEFVIWLIQLARLLGRAVWFVFCHPLLDLASGLIVLDYLNLGWPGLAGTAALIILVLVVVRLVWPDLFTRFVATPVRDGVRSWYYRRRWQAVMTITGLAPLYRGRVLLPVLASVAAGRSVDRVTVKLVSGQSPEVFADRAEAIAHGLGAHLCRIRPVAPGLIVLELVRRDTLAAPVAALPIPESVDLAAVPVGRCEDGTPWRLRLAGSHLLIAGATGAGKGSILWSIIRALLPGICEGWVQVWGLDPKRMELSFGRDLFARYADHATAMVALLEAAVTEMHRRATDFGGLTRIFTVSVAHPFLVVMIDELAFITAYQPERDLRKRAEAAIATLTSQGRSVGVCVVGALQDPRKDVINLRNLFPTRIAMRLDESDQVDMVLGDGARDRGALADQISPLPDTGAGIAYVRLEASPDPIRARAGHVTDADIRAMAELISTQGSEAA